MELEGATGIEPKAEKKDVNYFKKMVEDNTKELTDKCKIWETKMEKLPKTLTSYEDTSGDIRQTIGMANLLMNKKGRFEQFRSLIHNCEYGLGEKETTCMDLQGFWEMIYFQVEDVNSKFAKLEDLEAKNWISEPKLQTKVNTVKKAVIVSKPFKPKAKASSNLKAMLAAKRKAAMKVNKENDDPQIPQPQIQVIVTDEDVEQPKPTKKQEEEVKFDAGFFELASPAKTGLPKTDQQTLSAKRKSDAHALRKSILNKRVSMSCGASSSPWAIINATKGIRRSISRENTPIPQPDFEFDNTNPGDRKKLAPPRQSVNLMSFESPEVGGRDTRFLSATPIYSPTTPRRSARFQNSPRKNYKEI